MLFQACKLLRIEFTLAFKYRHDVAGITLNTQGADRGSKDSYTYPRSLLCLLSVSLVLSESF